MLTPIFVRPFLFAACVLCVCEDRLFVFLPSTFFQCTQVVRYALKPILVPTDGESRASAPYLFSLRRAVAHTEQSRCKALLLAPTP